MSPTRAELRRLRSLRRARGRAEEGLFAAEGVRVLEAARAAGARPVRVFRTSRPRDERTCTLIEAFRADGVPVEELTDRQLDSVADTRTPQGLIAVFPLPDASLPEPAALEARWTLLLEDVQDPGNLGTLLRSALAFGADRTLLAGACADAWSPKVVRASAGAVFALRIGRTPAGVAEPLASLEAADVPVVATAPSGNDDPNALRPFVRSGRLALAVGGEPRGLSRAVLDRAEARVRIDHSPRVESLNAAVAGSIVLARLWEIARRDGPEGAGASGSPSAAGRPSRGDDPAGRPSSP